MELVVDVGLIDGIAGFQAEALIWTSGCDVISAIEPLNRAVTLGIEPGQRIELYIEAASNPDIALLTLTENRANNAKAGSSQRRNTV